jgi:hypothetical protein
MFTLETEFKYKNVQFLIGIGEVYRLNAHYLHTDFSVVLFRPNFMLFSEKNRMKAHKNQRLLATLSPRDIPCGATHQGTHQGVWAADAFAVP